MPFHTRYVVAIAAAALLGCGGGNNPGPVDAAMDGDPDAPGADAALPDVSGGGGPEIGGIYQVQSFTRNDAGCAEGPAAPGPQYFQLTRGPIGYASYRECTSADAATCSARDTIARVSILSMPSATGWSGAVASAGGSASRCALGFLTTTASLLADGRTLRVESRGYGETVAVPACMHEEARRRGTTMPCLFIDVMTGTRVSP